LKTRHIRPTHALNAGPAYAFILNFWQSYASYATATPEACVANKGHACGSLAKLCFLIGKIILPVTSASIGVLAHARSGALGIPHPQLIAGARSKQEDQLQF
jgi:hypothetical protein